jgi:hypothetical protein
MTFGIGHVGHRLERLETPVQVEGRIVSDGNGADGSPGAPADPSRRSVG